MTLRSFHRPLALFLLPWLLALLELFSAGYAGPTRPEPPPPSGCTLDPWGGCL